MFEVHISSIRFIMWQLHSVTVLAKKQPHIYILSSDLYAFVTPSVVSGFLSGLYFQMEIKTAVN